MCRRVSRELAAEFYGAGTTAGGRTGSNYKLLLQNKWESQVRNGAARLRPGRVTMFGYKKLLMTAAMGVGLLAVPTYAQYNQGYPGNYSHDSERSAYQQGVKDAQWDNTHGSQNRNRNWKNDYDARAYRDGYNSA